MHVHNNIAQFLHLIKYASLTPHCKLPTYGKHAVSNEVNVIAWRYNINHSLYSSGNRVLACSLKQMGTSAVNVRPARMLPGPDELSVEIRLYPITNYSCHSSQTSPDVI
ncbi:hypothetical protein E1301_Tti001027 [Triplophysa tibetana]|uniref:Uncharacterized protein n=1 Tax=Triplophysa tibetana TaxID=1572043 RepID=A0A5A9N622_9TELE|nr:hypothetical protein E1301_Tti001027 [Triplophysa tibetana]